MRIGVIAPKVSPGATRTIVDMAGRHVQVPITVTRVATNIPLIPHTIYLLGGISRLVAATTTPATPLFTTIHPAIKTLPGFPTSSVDAEELLKLRPQVFIMTNLTQSLLPTLTRLGIPVVEVGGATNGANLEATVNLVADVLGGDAPARAKQFASYYDGNVKLVEAKTGTVPDSSRPTVYYAPGPNPTTTVGSGNIITDSIDEAGGQNIAATHGIGASQGGSFAFPTINAEDLLRWNPQVIVAISAKIQQQFMSDSRYATLDAVRNHRVYACPAGIFAWCASSAEAAFQPLWMAETLHPDLFLDVNLRNEVKDFYAQFYRYTLSDQQITAILNPDGSK
ncbi:MAG: ABC transporter substrate-binding protein [Pseudonocardiaceae bacterium]